MCKTGCINRRSNDLRYSFPCLNCTKSIIQAGIKTIYYAQDYHNNDYAIKLLKQSELNIKIPFSPEYVAQYLTQE